MYVKGMLHAERAYLPVLIGQILPEQMLQYLSHPASLSYLTYFPESIVN